MPCLAHHWETSRRPAWRQHSSRLPLLLIWQAAQLHKGFIAILVRSLSVCCTGLNEVSADRPTLLACCWFFNCATYAIECHITFITLLDTKAAHRNSKAYFDAGCSNGITRCLRHSPTPGAQCTVTMQSATTMSRFQTPPGMV